jgi:hypothetical protein
LKRGILLTQIKEIKMKASGYLFLMTASLIGMLAVFVLFIYTLATMDRHDNGTTVILYVFLFLGLILAAAITMAFSLIRYVRSKAGRSNVTMTKTCTSCGQTMRVTEFSCPKCLTLQPADEHGRGR